jgi:L-malate glycosyltransferase
VRILIVNFEYPPLGGGGGVATKQIAEKLSSKHEVHVVTTKYKDLPQFEIVNDVRIHRVKVWGRNSLPTATLTSLISFVPVAVVKMLSLTRDVKFDVINAQFVLPSGLASALIARLKRIPMVLSFVGGDIYDPTKGTSPHRFGLLRWVVRQIARQAVSLTAISKDTAQRARELHGVRGDIKVVHLGIEPFYQELKQQEDTWISIGRLVPRKGYEVLLEAWKDVPEAKLIILGGGPLKNKLSSMAKQLGLTDRVEIAGYVSREEKYRHLLEATGYVSAAEHEGFGIVFLEAMEAGLPIATTNEGGQNDFLKHNENAILFDPRDVQALASGVRKLQDDAQLRKRMGVKNREDVKKFYLEKTVAAFESILENASSTRN